MNLNKRPRTHTLVVLEKCEESALVDENNVEEIEKSKSFENTKERY